jgi:anti-sigma factor RsiW
VTSHLDEGVLNALLDGEIPSSEIPALQAHLTGCEACQSRLEESRALRDQAFALIDVLDEATEAPVGAAVIPLRPREPARRRRVWATGLAWAASLALAATAGFYA